MEHYISVRFKTDEKQTAILSALLMDTGFEGVEENENETIAYIHENHFEENELKNIFDKFSVPYTLNKIEQQNWNASWESSFEPVQVGNFAAIRASFHSAIIGVEHDILITPKMSFGTGHHATTFLMIQEMQLLDFKDQVVIDFGTGTGVLAILADKLGAKEITAIDNDEWSIHNAQENIEANHCKNILLYKADEMSGNKKANIILANINLNVIIANISLIKNACLPGTQVLLSGLMNQDEKIITEVLNTIGFDKLKCVSKNNWIAILAKIV